MTEKTQTDQTDTVVEDTPCPSGPELFMDQVSAMLDLVAKEFTVQESFAATYYLGRAYDRSFRLMLQKMRGAMTTQSGAGALIDEAIRVGNVARRKTGAMMEGLTFWLGQLSRTYSDDTLRVVSEHCDAQGWTEPEARRKAAAGAGRLVKL